MNLTCYRCGGMVDVSPTEGGRGTGELTRYRADCYGQGQTTRDGCGMFQAYLGTNGTRKSAEAHYRRIAKALTGHEEVSSK